jgi:hypothetical protein
MNVGEESDYGLEENKKNIRRALLTLLTLFSTIIHAMVFTIMLYMLKLLTGMSINTESISVTYMFVAVVTLSMPINLLIGIGVTVLHDYLFRWIPDLLLKLIIKVLEVVFVWGIVTWVDYYMDGVQLSVVAHVIFAYAIYIVAELWVSRGKRPRKL